MPANEQYDVLLGQPGNLKGWMLVRPGRSGAARAWKRYGVRVSPQGGSPDEARFNQAPDEVRFADTWDDFSGGFGYAYRTAAPANGIHWSENMDTRFVGQAVHCQALLVASTFDPNIIFSQAGPDPEWVVGGQQWLIDVPLKQPSPPIGFGGVVAIGRGDTGTGGAQTGGWRFYPQNGVFPARVDGTGVLAANTAAGDPPDRAGPPAIFGSYLYVGGATANFTRYHLDGTNGTMGPIPARGFLNNGNRLWAAVGPPNTPNCLRSIAAGADGMTSGDWSASIPVGNGLRPVQDMESVNGQVFLGMADGIYAGDQSGTFSSVTGALAGQSNTDNFRDLCVHQGVVVGQAVGGIFAFDPTNTATSRVQQIGPAFRSNKSPAQGYATAVESFGGWLYAGLWTGSQSWLMAGTEAENGYRWNLMNRIPIGNRVSRLHFDGITYASGTPAVAIPNRLWVAMDGSFGNLISAATLMAAPLYFQPIPRVNANPLAADPVFSANYNGSARMVLPRSDRGAPGVLKMYEYAEVWADAFLSGSRYADVYYAVDGGARTLLGRAQTSPVSTLYFTQSNPSFFSGRSIELDVESYDATPGTCQTYRSFVVYGVMRPNQSDVVDAVFHVGDNVPDRRGVAMRPGRVMADELRSFADPNRLGGQILTLIDLAGATQNVVVVGEPTESEYYQDGSRDPELQVAVKLAVLTYSGA